MRRVTAVRSLGAVVLSGLTQRIAYADTRTVRVSFEPVNTLQPFYVAQDEGFFKKNNLTVVPEAANGGSAATAALVAGSLDIVSVNIVSMAAAREKGIPLVFVALSSLYSASSPADALLVPKGSPIKTARDLNGKTIATSNLKGLGYVGARLWIDQNGGDSSTVRFIEMTFDLMPAMLQTHQVDAAMIAEPAMERAWPTSTNLGYAYNAIGDTVLISGWAATKAWVDQNRDVGQRFNDALIQSEEWCDRNGGRAAAIASRYLKMDTATIRSMSHAPYPERRNAIPLAQPLLNAAFKYGVLSSALPAADLFASYLIPATAR
jgi:NitT/TauT family transport system substrate-binding protein